jgi:hypothetical protein
MNKNEGNLLIQGSNYHVAVFLANNRLMYGEVVHSHICSFIKRKHFGLISKHLNTVRFLSSYMTRFYKKKPRPEAVCNVTSFHDTDFVDTAVHSRYNNIIPQTEGFFNKYNL